MKTLCRAVAIPMLLLLAACTSVPFDAPKTVTRATDLPVSFAEKSTIQENLRRRPGKSALVPLVDGNDALGVRLEMINGARHSLDLQYFLLKPDHAGALFATALLAAADRGVRVRLLLDDALTSARGDQIARLDAHPGIEIRMLNPLSRNSPAVWNFIADFGRVNRRMHNKSMTADRSYAIIGGRNIADEYYSIDTKTAFADFDVLLAGPVVAEITHQFDTYWNDRLAVPHAALMAQTGASTDIDAADPRLRARHAEALNGIYERAVNSRLLADAKAGRIKPNFARIRLSSDHPDKLKVPVADGERVLATDLLAVMSQAREDVILVTPYFVPQDWGERFFIDLAARGVRVRIVTNSLASTNHAYVHGGYNHRRKALLEAGVELYELRVDALEALGLAPEGAGQAITMHTKLAMIDSEQVFVGSLNFDPRSIKINTEVGVFLSNPEIGAKLNAALDEDFARFTWKLDLDADGDLTWTYANGGRVDLRRSEPDASGWSKFVAGVTRWLPVEGQL